MFNFSKIFSFLNSNKPLDLQESIDPKKSIYWVNLYENGQVFGYKTLHQANKRKSAISRVKVEFKKGRFDA